MKNYISFLMLCLFLQGSVFAQMRPCVNGMAGNYPCNDYDFMSNINVRTLSGATGKRGNDIWGWTDPTSGKEYAIMCLTSATAFVDVTDPINPVYLGKLPTATRDSSWRDVKVYGDHAFIVSEANNHGMQVFDLKRLRTVTNPRNFDADARYTGAGACHNIVINESEGIAYLVGCRSTNGGGPIFIDIKDPKNPRMVGEYRGKGYSHDAQVITYNGPDREHAGKEIYIGSNENEVIVADVTDKSRPRLLGNIGYSQRGYTHQGWFTEDQRYFILGDELDEQRNGFNTKTLVFDMRDLDRPVLRNTFFGATKAIDHNGYVKGNEYFLANYTAGMRVLGLDNVGGSSNNSLKEVGFFDSYPRNNNASFNGVWSVYPYFKSGNILLSNIEDGLFVVRKSNTLSVDDTSIDQTIFTLTPNPTSSNPVIKASEANVVESVEVFNVLGQNIFKKADINQNTFTIPMASHSKGIYLVKINDKVTKKLVLN